MKNQKKNIDRLDEPTGRLGVPPDAPGGAGLLMLDNKVIIVTDKSTAMELLGRLPQRTTLPS